MEKVWPGIAVEENNLTQNISALRKALGERRDEPQYILTVSGLGYRFIASVNETWPAKVKLRETATISYETIGEEGTEADHPNGFAHTSVEPLTQMTPSAPAFEPATTVVGRHWKILLASALAAVIVLAGGYYLLSRRSKHPTTSAAANAQIKSIAILPFKPLSEGTDE